jgi:hypothetical protein
MGVGVAMALKIRCMACACAGGWWCGHRDQADGKGPPGRPCSNAVRSLDGGLRRRSCLRRSSCCHAGVGHWQPAGAPGPLCKPAEWQAWCGNGPQLPRLGCGVHKRWMCNSCSFTPRPAQCMPWSITLSCCLAAAARGPGEGRDRAPRSREREGAGGGVAPVRGALWLAHAGRRRQVGALPSWLLVNGCQRHSPRCTPSPLDASSVHLQRTLSTLIHRHLQLRGPWSGYPPAAASSAATAPPGRATMRTSLPLADPQEAGARALAAGVT